MRRIIWAIDPWSEDKKLETKIANQIQNWTKSGDAVVEPVTILSPDQFYPPTNIMDFKLPVQNLEEEIKNRVAKQLKGKKIKGLEAPTVLTSKNVSLRHAVKTLLDYAHSRNAELIVVGTQSKKAVSRFLFGSFAETLILQADVPTYIIGPKMKESKKVTRIFYPTDLTPTSEQAYEKVLEVAKSMKVPVTIFHKLDYVSTYTYPTLAATPAFEQYLEEDTERKTKTLEGWKKKAESHGVKANFILDSKSSVSVPEAAIAAAKKSKSDLIALVSQTGPVMTAILGSVTRQVLRNSPCPIWVIHPPREAETQVRHTGASKHALSV